MTTVALKRIPPCTRCGATKTTRLRTYTGRVLCTNLAACRRREKRRPAPEPNPSRKEPK